MKIQAMVAHAPNTPLVLEELDLAAPRDDEVLIEIMASGLCHTDLSQLEGKAAPYPFPIVVGHEGAGIVREVGASVTSVKVAITRSRSASANAASAAIAARARPTCAKCFSAKSPRSPRRSR